MRGTCLANLKEGWELEDVCRHTCHQQNHDEVSIPHPAIVRHAGHVGGVQGLFQLDLRSVPPNQDEANRRVEDNFQNEGGTVRVVGDAI